MLRPSSDAPVRSTGLGPHLSSSAPQPKLAKAIAINPSVIALDMPVRDQPVACDIGCRNTGNENNAPIATQPINPPAATMTQRYDSFDIGLDPDWGVHDRSTYQP